MICQVLAQVLLQFACPERHIYHCLLQTLAEALLIWYQCLIHLEVIALHRSLLFRRLQLCALLALNL